jgi:hypothetical protein
MNIESSGNTQRKERDAGVQVVHHSGSTMHDAARLIEQNWQKAVTIFLVLVAGIWFYNEYRTTMRLKKEEASQSFSRASMLLSAIISDDYSSPELKDASRTEVIERYLDEMKRLSTDFSETPYAPLADVLAAAYALSRTSSYESIPMDPAKVERALSSLAVTFKEDPLIRITSEMQLLLYARYLLAVQSSESIEEGRGLLNTLIEQAEIFPVEAAMSYLLSYEPGSEGYKGAFASFDGLVRRYPQIETALVQECARLGIAYEPAASPESAEQSGSVTG